MAKKKAGRPSKYTPAIGELICERIATHAIGLRRLCTMFNDMPSEDTINKWRFKYPEFKRQFDLAKAFQCELLAESMHDLSNEIGTYQDSEGNIRVDSGSVNAQRLKIDTIKFTVSKLLPKIYGDKKPQKIEPDSLLEQSMPSLNGLDAREASRIYQQIMRGEY